jgi:hypothetical protein
MSTAPPEFAAEPTEIDFQTLILEVTPITAAGARCRSAEVAQKSSSAPCDFRLFDFAAQDQMELFPKLPPSLPTVRKRGIIVPVLVRTNGEPDSDEIVVGAGRFHVASIGAARLQSSGDQLKP